MVSRRGLIRTRGRRARVITIVTTAAKPPLTDVSELAPSPEVTLELELAAHERVTREKPQVRNGAQQVEATATTAAPMRMAGRARCQRRTMAVNRTPLITRDGAIPGDMTAGPPGMSDLRGSEPKSFKPNEA